MDEKPTAMNSDQVRRFAPWLRAGIRGCGDVERRLEEPDRYEIQDQYRRERKVLEEVSAFLLHVLDDPEGRSPLPREAPVKTTSEPVWIADGCLEYHREGCARMDEGPEWRAVPIEEAWELGKDTCRTCGPKHASDPPRPEDSL